MLPASGVFLTVGVLAPLDGCEVSFRKGFSEGGGEVAAALVIFIFGFGAASMLAAAGGRGIDDDDPTLAPSDGPSCLGSGGPDSFSRRLRRI